MSKLIHLRQRMQAIETIKKITHAMRLVSMSAHSRLRNRKDALHEYVDHLEAIFNRIHQHTQDWTHPIAHPHDGPNRNLIILVGSQKSLCGSFNTTLIRYFGHKIDVHHPESNTIIGIGKKAIELARETVGCTVHAAYETFAITNLSNIVRTITDRIVRAQPAYTSVQIVSNRQKSFFIQKPSITHIVPYKTAPDTQSELTQEGYQWEHEPHAILDMLFEQCLEARIYQTLFESLLAEHAARFVSMDSSTRNAKNLLEATRTQYNRLRQGKITKELTELSSSFAG